MVTSKIYGSDLMMDTERDEILLKTYEATIPLKMTVRIESENDIGIEEIADRVGDLITVLCEYAYKSRRLSEIENLSVDMGSKWDVVVL